MKVTIDKHGNASSTQSQDLIRPNSTFVGGLAQAIGNIGETIGHGVHDASHAVGLDNITEGIERGMEDASHAVHNAVDDAYEAVDEVGGFLQSKASRATISIEVGAHNAMAKGLNTLNETFQFGFNRIEEKEQETQKEVERKRLTMVADVTKRNEETKKKGTTMGRRSTTNAAQERRKVMFNKADESESAKFAKGNMFMNGEGGLWKVTTEELGTMGVGIQLYFQISKILSVAFLVMTLCHVPTMWLNSSGNGGYALSADLKSSFASLSLANQGFSWATVQEPDCIVNGGDADCSGLTVDIHGTRWDAHEVSATILACEMAAAIVFIITCGLCVIVVQKMDAQVDDENAEPEDYAVFVRNLPKDVTIQDLIDNFSDKYALDKETQHYPAKLNPVGLATRRANKYFWWWLLFVSPVVTWLVADITGDARTGAIAGLWSGLIIVADSIWTMVSRKGSTPEYRKTPVQMYDEEHAEELKARKANEKKMKARKTKRDEKKKARVGAAAKVYAEEEGGGEEEEEEKYDPLKDPLRPNPQPVKDVSNTGNKIYMNSWIAEISLVHPTGGVIESFKKQESAMKRMKVRQIKLEKRELNARNAKLIEANKQRIGKKGTRLKEIAKGHSKSVIAAFVVFNCEESKNRCIEDYVETGSTFFRYFQPTFLNMVKDGKHYKLRVEGAPTPSLVFWENLHLSDFERFMRVSLTTAITTILLILSFAMIYVTNLYNQSALASIPDSTLCSLDLPAIIQGNRSFNPEMELVHNKELDGTLCGPGQFHITYPSYDYSNLNNFYANVIVGGGGADGGDETARTDTLNRDFVNSLYANFTGEGKTDSGGLPLHEMCDSACHNASKPAPGPTDDVSEDSEACGSLGCQLQMYGEKIREDSNTSKVLTDFECAKYSKDTVVGCFCLQELEKVLMTEGMGAWATMKDPSGEGKVCSNFADNYFNAQILTVVGALFIVVINLVLKEVMKLLVKVERHASAASASQALTLKITAAQFLNTAVIGLLMNTHLNDAHKKWFNYEGTMMERFGLLDGEFQDFHREWYATVGTSLCLTMLVNIVVPHVSVFSKGIFARPVKIKLLAKKAAAKVEMDKLYQMDRFEIETRYAALLNYLLVCSLYSGAMPLMFLFASLNFGLSFVLDKYAIMRLNKQPLKYDSALAKMMVNYMIPLAVILHLAFTAYAYSTPALVDKEDGHSELRFWWLGGNGRLEGEEGRVRSLEAGELSSVMLVSDPVGPLLEKLAIKLQGSHFIIDDILPRAIRTNVLPVLMLLGGFTAAAILINLFGEVLFAALKLLIFDLGLKAAEMGKGAVGTGLGKAFELGNKAGGIGAMAGKMALDRAKDLGDKAAAAGKAVSGVDAKAIAGKGMGVMGGVSNMVGDRMGGVANLADNVGSVGSGLVDRATAFEVPKVGMAAMKADAQPDFTSLYSANMRASQIKYYKRHGTLNANESAKGFVGVEEGWKVWCVYTKDTTTDDGVHHKAGKRLRTWEVMKMAGIHNYNIEENDFYDMAVSFMIEEGLHEENEGRGVDGGRQARIKAIAMAVLKFRRAGQNGLMRGISKKAIEAEKDGEEGKVGEEGEEEMERDMKNPLKLMMKAM